MGNGTPKAWEKQEQETSRAWNAFRVYRDLGANRTLENCVVLLGKPPRYLSQLKKWSTTYGWVKRCEQFDGYMDAQALKLQEKDNRSEYKEKLHKYRVEADIASRTMVSMGIKTMKVLQYELDKRLKNVQDLKASEIAVLMRAAIMSVDVGNKLFADVMGIDDLLEILDEKEPG